MDNMVLLLSQSTPKVAIPWVPSYFNPIVTFGGLPGLN